jgi:serine/threonine-protein kinase
MTGELDLGIDELGRYEPIGSGGFSTVYSAWDEGFQRRVAVKVLHSLDEAGRRRFDRERAIMGQLGSHPNVITPYRAGYTANGAPYLIMEYVAGGSLADLVERQGKLPWTVAVDYVVEATGALGHAHDQGVLHRDVKPGNILLADSVPKLTDFGIAAIRESTASQVAFTLAHCPPETFSQGRDARDERSDLYSMASTLFTLVTGSPPFDIEGEDSQQAYMFRIIGHEVPDLPAELIPEPVRAFLRRGLSKEPDERPQTASQFQEELRRVRQVHLPHQSGPPGSGTNPPTYQPPLNRPITGPATPGTHTDPGAPTISTGPATPGTHTEPGAPIITTGPGGHRPLTDPPGRSTAGDDDVTQMAWTSEPGGRTDGGSKGGRHEPDGRIRRRLLVGLAALVIAAAGVGGWWAVRGGDDAGGPPEVAWRFETESSLASRPAVADGVLVIGATVTNMVHAIDTTDGAERWSFRTDGAVPVGAAITDGTAYIGSEDGRLYAFDLDSGEPRWAQSVGSPVTSGTLIAGDLAVVGTANGEVWALERATGDPRWTTPTTDDSPINATPGRAEVDGQPVIVVGSTDGGLYLLAVETGEPLERIALEGGVWFSDPLVLDRPDGSSQEVWIGTSLSEGGFLNRVNLETGEVRTFTNAGGVGTDPILTPDGAIVAGNDAGELFAVDRVTLGERWREGYAQATQIKGSPAVHDDQIIFGTHDRELIAVDLDGNERWRFEGEQIFGLSAPVVVGDELYVGNDSGTVYRFDL